MNFDLPQVNVMWTTAITFIVGLIIHFIPAEIQSRWKGVIAFLVTAIVVVPVQITTHVTDFSTILVLVFATWLAAMGLHQGAKSVVANK